MGMKITDRLVADVGDHHLKNYDETVATFNWGTVEKAFSWYTTGKLNAAYEAIDRHTEGFRKDKIALYFDDGNRKESYSFNEMKMMTNKAANVFKEFSSLQKG
ncbi:acetate--CoA ligase, partial [Butyricicoccus sp. 1XD8-22]